MSRKKAVVKLALLAGSLLGSLIVGELALRVYDAVTAPSNTPPEIPMYDVADPPRIYRLNPEHPEINARGMRDDDIAVPKPDSTHRILVLGDSIAYGRFVAKEEGFTDRLEILLRQAQGGGEGETERSVEVVNSGVPGYTAYNELQYYLTVGRQLEPDVVLITFCMNDVVNPRLHWNYAKLDLMNVPPRSIPNARYDKEHAIPALQERERLRASPPLSEQLHLLRALRRYIPSLRPQLPALRGARDGQVMTCITGEDTIGIDVLMKDSSPEWQWLTSVYDELQDAVEGDGRKFAVALFPLAYQLDKGYPFRPQERIAKHCAGRGVPCLDLLPAFRRHPKADVFFLEIHGFWDVWHPNPRGHQLAAEELVGFLQKNELAGGG